MTEPLPRRRKPDRPARKWPTASRSRPMRDDEEYQEAVHDLKDALERLERLGQSPFPVGDPASGSVASWGVLGIMMREESLIWNPAISPDAPRGSWDRWPHTWSPEGPPSGPLT
ncbi:hypothetical protein [Streptomyces xiamenensis]|uniref:hypothetical protein n=1 Tax=Streptomyces xiamenensis TaxID=408015 RepID=UPI0035D9ADA5